MKHKAINMIFLCMYLYLYLECELEFVSFFHLFVIKLIGYFYRLKHPFFQIIKKNKGK